MKKAAALPLARLFAVGLFSAEAGFLLRGRVGEKLAPFLDGRMRIAPESAAYVLVFLLSFALLSFASRRVSIRFGKPKLETVQGAAPRLARGMLALGLFALPLAVIPGQNAHKAGVSLRSLIVGAERKAAAQEQGYGAEDRQGLTALTRASPRGE